MRITIISITLFLIMTKLLVGAESISRADFPEGFVFGTASSAHQVCISVFLLYIYI